MDDETLVLPEPQQKTPWERDESISVFDHHLHRGQRHVPMKVLVLGLSRTGTLSLRHALFRLGYFDVYHGTSFGQEDSRGGELWMKAVKAKYEDGPPMIRQDWEDLLGHCMGVADLPCYVFASELIEVYPDAKVILSVRDSAEAWRASVLKTTLPCAQATQPKSLFAKFMWMFVQFNPCTAVYMKLIKYARILDVEWDALRIYEDHNAFVRRIVPADRLLEFNVKEGWKPLCDFLGHPVPEGQFPKVNDVETFTITMQRMYTLRGSAVVKRMLWTVTTCLVPVVGVVIWASQSMR